jgi:hypothetical protein
MGLAASAEALRNATECIAVVVDERKKQSKQKLVCLRLFHHGCPHGN